MLTFSLQVLWYSIEAFGNGTGDAGQCITVPTKGYSGANDILEGFPFQKGGDGFRDSFLAGFHMVVGGTNFITGTAQIIAKLLLDIGFDLRLAVAVTG